MKQDLYIFIDYWQLNQYMYRVKQFLWAIISFFKKIDDNILEKYLDSKEIELFMKLKKSEQYLSIRVCKDSLKMCEINNLNKYKMAKISLLHDIGKIEGSLNVMEKSILVIMNKLTKGKMKNIKNNKKIDLYYNHPIKSVNILKDINKYDDEFLDAIKYHHSNELYENNYLKVLKICDEKN